MKKNINKFILVFFMLFLVFASVSVPATEISQGAAISGWGAKCAPGGVPTDVRQAIMNVTNWILGFISIVSVLVVIYGLVAGADTIKYGLVGLVVCGLAYAIVIVISTVILG